MSKLNIVMPMAGRGSRFVKQGILEPKPLVDLGGRPFFWWAMESLRRVIDIDQIVCVVLEEHQKQFCIADSVHSFYPNATIVEIPDVTAGSSETASIGMKAITSDHPCAVQDCDHALIAPTLSATVTTLHTENAAALCTFTSSNPAYSYAEVESNQVRRTVEKQVISPHAIAGCYLFRSAELFQKAYTDYLKDCPYDELFVSGVLNSMLAAGLHVGQTSLQAHFSFGTPEEYRRTMPQMLNQIGSWRLD